MLFLVFSCGKNETTLEEKTENSQQKLTETQKQPTKIIKHITYKKDTIGILEEEIYNRTINDYDFKKYDKISPEELYNKKAYQTLDFGSEQGKDLFFIIYEHYFFKKNKNNINPQELEEFRRLYYVMNWINNNGGGPGFGHDIHRIPAISLYDFMNSDKKKIPVNENQKKRFINSIENNWEPDFDSIMKVLSNEIKYEYQLKLAKKYHY